MGLDAVVITSNLLATPKVSFNLITDDDDKELDSKAPEGNEPGEPQHVDTLQSTTEGSTTSTSTGSEPSEYKARQQDFLQTHGEIENLLM